MTVDGTVDTDFPVDGQHPTDVEIHHAVESGLAVTSKLWRKETCQQTFPT